MRKFLRLLALGSFGRYDLWPDEYISFAKEVSRREPVDNWRDRVGIIDFKPELIWA